MNDGSPTRFDKYSNRYSHIDITLVDTRISSKFTWKVNSDRLISDHFPITLDCDVHDIYTSKPKKWIVDKAKWKEFSSDLHLPERFLNADLDCENITEAMLVSGKSNIPMTRESINHLFSNSWWTPECKTASDEAKDQFTRVKRNCTTDNVNIYNELEAISNRVLLEAKRQSWREYIGTITRTTKIKEIWNKIRSLDGKYSSQGKIILKVNDVIKAEPQMVADELGEFFSFVNSDDNYSEEFRRYKTTKEQEIIEFPDNDRAFYNRTFRMYELEAVLINCKGSSPGPDELHYDMFKNLSIIQKKKILNFINFLWCNDVFPDKWREAIIIPIHKPFKDACLCSSYRPISLTSCFCKIVEKLVYRRFARFLEKKGIIRNYQSGARRSHSTYDSLVRFESAIRETLLRADILVAVFFFDIEKAYDLLWSYAVLKILKDIGLEGHLPKFI